MHAIRGDAHEEIRAHFGSLEAWQAIGDWSTFDVPQPSRVPSLLDHGYDEDLPATAWDADLYRDAADFRGGGLITGDVTRGDIATPLAWTCAHGHIFAASPRLVLTAGHWCPECVRPSVSGRCAARGRCGRGVIVRARRGAVHSRSDDDRRDVSRASTT
ncbi:hypothetical protein [Microbacterium lacticum]